MATAYTDLPPIEFKAGTYEPVQWEPNPHVTHAIDQAIEMAALMRASEARDALLKHVADVWRFHNTVLAVCQGEAETTE